jgi:hypothetical protein
MDSVSHDGAPPERWLLPDSNLKDQIARIKLTIAKDAIGFGLLEPLDQGLEITDVLFGPFDLYPDPGEIGLRGHDQYKRGVMASKRSKLP